jgi:hypothetical protein
MQFSPIPKACPRCKGFMISLNDEYGRYGSCMACGYHHDPPQAVDLNNLLLDESWRASRQRPRGPSHGIGGTTMRL